LAYADNLDDAVRRLMLVALMQPGRNQAHKQEGSEAAKTAQQRG